MNKTKNYTYNKRKWKFILLIFAFVIGIISTTYTGALVKKIKHEEKKSMELWAEAISYLANVDGEIENINFYAKIIQQNTTIPIILCNNNDSVSETRNLNINREIDYNYLQNRIKKMKKQHSPIIINLPGGKKNTIYYEDSTILKQLSIYPYIQLGIISIFIAIAYFAFSSSRKAEQNQVWVGMAKETAHQLGTPISSLMAWVEILKTNKQEYSKEIEKDINRLETIAERFSKIGSTPELPITNLVDVLKSSVAYMQLRTSDKVKIQLTFADNNDIMIPLNSSLFNWVVENVLKNAVDAIQNKGAIKINVSQSDKQIFIRISDNGKGIAKNKQKIIFKPGYTSKNRGWGLGLSLAKRIIEQYHKGKIMVENSETNKGTTFKISLPVC